MLDINVKTIDGQNRSYSVPDSVNFYFDLFNSDKHSLYINICSEKFYSDLKIDTTEFEKVLIKQLEYYNKFQEKIKQDR